MHLDRTTYEAWLLDRIEGNLTPEQERVLDAFLAANPELPVWDEELPSVSVDAPAFAAKELLRKHFPPEGAPDPARLTDFLIARLEGTLSTEQEQLLDRYLYEHPEAAREAKLVAATRSETAAVAFSDKDSIARHFPPHGLPDTHRLTDFLIAAREGDLTLEQRAALQAYVAAHPEAAREQRLVAATFVAKEAISFVGKERLKKRDVRVVPLWTRLAAAASVVLVLGLGWWLLRGAHGEEQRIARQEKEAAPVVPSPHREANVPQPEVSGPEQAVPEAQEERTTKEEGAAQQRMQPSTPVQEHGVTPRQQEEPARWEAPAPIPVPEPSDAPEPSLAQAPAVTLPAATATPATKEEPALAQAAQPAPMEGAALATVVANTVRSEVLDAPQRNTALDGNDAVAMMDKGLHALTGGTGGVQVQRTGGRDRLQVRLGRGLSISASRGR
ncbi:MAG TPA: hypothetical protein VHL57_05265 [Flavobacteriales bacterium]|jgi:outer membrane biosynthesis protein TonB|nr:hypothetical protein [Flavobacteriales bacterium]